MESGEVSLETIFRAVILDKISRSYQVVVPRDNIRFSLIPEMVSNDLLARLEVDFVSNTIEESFATEVRTYPSTWWDHIKLTLLNYLSKHFGSLDIYYSQWLASHPIKFLEVTLQRKTSHYHICPHLIYPLSPHLEFLLDKDWKNRFG